MRIQASGSGAGNQCRANLRGITLLRARQNLGGGYADARATRNASLCGGRRTERQGVTRCALRREWGAVACATLDASLYAGHRVEGHGVMYHANLHSTMLTMLRQPALLCEVPLGQAPCGSAVYGRVDEMSPAPSPFPLPLPLAWTPPMDLRICVCMTYGRLGQGRIDNITGKGLRTAVALSTASCIFCAVGAACNARASRSGRTHVG